MRVCSRSRVRAPTPFRCAPLNDPTDADAAAAALKPVCPRASAQVGFLLRYVQHARSPRTCVRLAAVVVPSPRASPPPSHRPARSRHELSAVRPRFCRVSLHAGPRAGTPPHAVSFVSFRKCSRKNRSTGFFFRIIINIFFSITTPVQ